MEVIPAIDLRGGQVVRLYQGDFRRETRYSQDPVRTALEWQEAGAPRIHIVDLDGAKEGSPANLDVVGRIAESASVPLQFGGGIRTLEAAREVAGLGVQRIVFGTAAVKDPTLVSDACRELGTDAVIVGVDARQGRVAVRGWLEAAPVTPQQLMEEIAALGVGRFIYTDIASDGTLAGPSFEAIAVLVEAIGVPIVASGGVASIEDLERLAALGVEGAIVGSALYTGAIDLQEAVGRFGG